MLAQVLLPGCPFLPTLDSWLRTMCSYCEGPVRNAEAQAPPQTYDSRLCISIPPPYQVTGMHNKVREALV